MPKKQRDIRSVEVDFPDLTFDPDLHIYRHAGNVLPSVTQVINAQLTPGVWDAIPPNLLKVAQERGKSVHEVLLYHDLDIIDQYNIAPRWLRFRDAWAQLCQESGLEPLFFEQPVMFDAGRFAYAGTLDRICALAAALVLLDFKTGKPKLTDKIQLAAYSYAVQQTLGFVPDEHWLVYFSEPDNGPVKCRPVRIPQATIFFDAQTFLHANTTYLWRRENGYIPTTNGKDKT